MPLSLAPQVFRLGDLAPARGSLDHVNLGVHHHKVARGTELMSVPTSYTPYIHSHVICIDDRLHGAAGLAGGALSLALMHNYIFGGRLLSQALLGLLELGTYLSFHEQCGALELASSGFIQYRLTNVWASGYTVLERLGYTVPMAIRRNIARWVRELPARFIDLDKSMSMAGEILGVSGDHITGFAGISLIAGYGFTAHNELRRATGMNAFRFDPAVAFREARRIAPGRTIAREAAYLALVFTTEVLLELGGPELVLGVCK